MFAGTASQSFNYERDILIHWLLVRTDIAATAREMLVKLQLCLGGALVESITKEYLRGRCGKGFTVRTQYLVDEGVIDQNLKADLDWVWDMRNKMHLFLLEDPEYETEYNVESHARCTNAFRTLVENLSSRGRIS